MQASPGAEARKALGKWVDASDRRLWLPKQNILLLAREHGMTAQKVFRRGPVEGEQGVWGLTVHYVLKRRIGSTYDTLDSGMTVKGLRPRDDKVEFSFTLDDAAAEREGVPMQENWTVELTVDEVIALAGGTRWTPIARRPRAGLTVGAMKRDDLRYLLRRAGAKLKKRDD